MTASDGIEIRRARRADGAAVAAIYAPVVRESATSFEVEPPTPREMADRIEQITSPHRWLVADDGQRGVVGYAYGSPHRGRVGYRYSVETSVYVHRDHQGRGVAAALYERLLADLVDEGFESVYAGIVHPNEASVVLHERFGFIHIGDFPKVGFKFDRWHTVGWWYLDLSDRRSGLRVSLDE